MTKIVILGSCRFEPYEVIAKPEKVEGKWNTEEGYQKATEKFYPAMQEADLILVYAPDGIGEHTQRDIDYAESIGKKVHVLIPLDAVETFEILQDRELMKSLHESLDEARQGKTIEYKPLEKDGPDTDITNSTSLKWEDKIRPFYMTPEEISPGYKERIQKRKSGKEAE